MSDCTAADLTYGDLLVEAFERYADREAFVQGDRRVTYREAADMIGRIRRVLETRGITLGRAVGALSTNEPEAWLAQAATYLLGGRYTGLHPLGSVDDHVYICDDAEIDVLIVHPSFVATGVEILEKSSTVKTLLTIGPADAGEDLIALTESVPSEVLRPGPARPEDTAWTQYTGGTTGRPKGVMLSHRAMVQAVESFTISFGLPQRPRYLASAPITHAAVLPVMPTLSRGGTVVLHQSFDTEEWARTVQRERINYVFLVPTMLYAVLDSGVTSRYDLSSLQTIFYGAAPMAPARIAEALKVFGPVLVQGYGQTECLAMATTLLHDEHDPDSRPDLLTSCGRAVAGVRIEVLGEDGEVLPAGRVGEMCIRSKAVMTGYRNMPELTAEVMQGGWLHTGDLAVRDDAGFFHIVDRKKDLIISGGFNVYPREVEDVITAQPDVAAAAVIGIPDDKWGEAVTAFVVPRTGRTINPDTIAAAVRTKKGAHQTPKHIEIIEALPTTAVGKIDKKKLRAGYWNSRSRNVN